MIAVKNRQGTALAVVSEPPARTPERQALADAIVARDYVAGLIKERHALVTQIEDSRSPLYRAEEALQERQRHLPKDDSDRLIALLSRRDPDTKNEREQIAGELASLQKQLQESWDAQRRAEADVKLLEEDHAARVRDVRDCVAQVVALDPCVPAVIAEVESLLRRLAILRRACGDALNERLPGQGYPPQYYAASKVVTPAGACPWEVIKSRLLNDPDAVLPMPEDV